ncbi:MAG TPA: ACP S-malonyltransferase [Gemmataceae bacterium]|nr:ACP S-malonyltransferase [Gemmataceae bacterium]
MPRTAFLFPGQGAQFVGMGRELAEQFPEGRRLYDESADILGYDLAQVCANGPAEKLNSTVVSQPAIFVTSLAALEKLRVEDAGVIDSCEAAAGLSLGEYTALVFAGAMSFRDGLELVRRRGEAMQEAADATPSGMLSILGLEVPRVQELCQQAQQAGILQVANLLCPGNTVVSGTTEALAQVQQQAEASGARTVRLAVAGAFHTPLMKPADERLAAALAGITLKPPRLPVWSNVDAQPHTDPAEIRQLLIRQVLQPVLWEQTIRNLLAAGFDRFYEIGPGRVLAGLLKRVQRKAECHNIGA